MMSRMLAIFSLLAVAACNTATGPALVATDVQPGLASCLTAIDRPDVAAEPEAEMSSAEIGALVACTTERATR